MIIKRNKFIERKIEKKEDVPQEIKRAPSQIPPAQITPHPAPQTHPEREEKPAESFEPEPQIVEEIEPDIFEGFDFDEIDFSQRSERRRGDRRRGYRRVDDRNLISRAQEEAILIKEEAMQEGYQSGLAEAHEVVSDLKDSLGEFFAYKHELEEKFTADILEIALAVAQKIIKREVITDKTILQTMVMDSLESLAKDENKIILKVAPTDVEYTKELVPDILSTGQIEAKIYVTGDKDIEEGSVLIETSNGVIDANISTQIGIIKESFKQI